MRRWVMRAGVAVVIGAVGFWWFGPPALVEPVYQGRTLGSWLDQREQSSRLAVAESMVAMGEADAAVRAIGPAAIPVLLDWLGRPDTWVRVTTEKIQRGFGFPEVVQTSRNRRRAVQGFLALGPAAKPEFSRIVAIALHSNDPYGQRRAAIDALRLADVATMRQLAAGLHDPDRVVRLNALEALSLPIAPDEVSLPALEGALNDPDSEVRAKAAQMIAIITKNLQNLATWLAATDPILRMSGIRQVATYRGRARAYLPILEAAKRDPDPGVSQTAAEAIEQIQTPRATP